jgi:glutathione S-transferase
MMLPRGHYKTEMQNAAWKDKMTDLEKLAAGLHKRHYTVEDVRAAWMACHAWRGSFHPTDEQAKVEALRRWPEEVHDEDR